MTPSVISLFSGIGGFDLALERLGCATIAHSEIDPYASAVMRTKFPDSFEIGDITTAHFERNDDGTIYIENARGDGLWCPPCDILVGGFPCQDISKAGKGACIEGKSSSLWSAFGDAIRVLRPKVVIVENVQTLLGRGVDTVLGDLAACGYDAEWDCIPARALGASHRRDRIFIVAYPARIGVEGHWSVGIEESWPPPEKGLSGCDSAGERTAQWEVEPRMGRVVDGVPHWVDRMRCLGNAVVPQVAEHVAKIALERLNG